MKTIITILTMMMFTTITLAQSATQKMSYQAIIRNSSNALVQNSPVGIKISILKTSITGPSVYAESHTKQTNQNGLLDIQIGGGIVLSGAFNDVNWGVPHFLKTEIDPLGGTNYTLTTTSELLSVPISNYAYASGTSTTSNTLNGVAWQFVGAYLGGFEGYSYINYIGSNKISFTYREEPFDFNQNGQIDNEERTYNTTLFGTVNDVIVTFPPQPDGYFSSNTPQMTGTFIDNIFTLTGVDEGGYDFKLEFIKQ